jgi:hypothetical protein
MSHPEVGQEVLDRALGRLGEAALVEKPPGMEGRFLSVILTPTVKKPAKGKEPGENSTSPEGNGRGETGTDGAEPLASS